MPTQECSDSVAGIFSSIQESGKQGSISVAKSRIVSLLSESTPLQLLDAILPPLRHILCHPTTNKFTRAYFELITSLIVDFSHVTICDERGTLMGALLGEIIHISGVKNKTVRARVCEVLCHIVSHHSETHFNLDSWEEKIYEYFFDLTRDKMVAVRSEAIKGLAKFVNPTDTKCPCVSRLLWHLKFDPSSEIRRKVLTLLPLTNETIEAIVSRVCDTNVEMRISVLKILGESVHPKYLKVVERMDILKMGVLEPNKGVKMAFKQHLLTGWLRAIDNDVIFLLERLDLIDETEISSKVSEHIFGLLPLGGVSKLWQEVTGLETTLPPPEGILTCPIFTPPNMTVVVAFLWSQLSKFVHGNKDIPPVCVECILPDPVQFSDFIVKYQEYFVSENGAYSAQLRFIFENILSLLEFIDYSNESGRDRTIVSIRSLITNREFHLSLIEPCLRHFSVVCPDANKRIMNLATAIIAMNVTTDGTQTEGVSASQSSNLDCATQELASQATQECDTLDRSFRSLQITNSLLQQVQISQPDSHLLSLVEYILIPNLLQHDFALRELALKGLGLASMTSLEMAHNVVPRFIMVATEALFLDHLTVQMAALNTILDLFLLYGDVVLKMMSILEMKSENADTSLNQSKDSIDPGTEIEPSLNKTVLLPQETPEPEPEPELEPEINSIRQHIFSLLLRVIQSDSPELQERALVGVCKLFLANRIRSCNLLGQVLIHSFHPVANTSTSLTDALFAFFYTFTSRCEENCVLLADSLIPTLWTIFEAPNDTFLSLVSLDSVCDKISFFLSQRNSHNLLVEPLLNLCIQNLDDDTMCRVAVKCLSQLDLSFFQNEIPVISHWGQLANQIAGNELAPKNSKFLETFQNKVKVVYPDYVIVPSVVAQTPQNVTKNIKSTAKKGYGRSTKVDRTTMTPSLATQLTPRVKSERRKKEINYTINFSSSDEDS